MPVLVGLADQVALQLRLQTAGSGFGAFCGSE